MLLTVDGVRDLLRTTLLERGIEQQELAAELKVSPQYLCDVLAGRRAPGPAIIRALKLERCILYRPARRAQ